MDDPIILTSSDSDIDFEFGPNESDDDAFSTNVGAEGYGEHFGNIFSSQSATGSSMTRPLNHGHTSHIGYPPQLRSGAGFCSLTPQRKSPSSQHRSHSMGQADNRAFPSNTRPSNLRDSEHMHKCSSSGNFNPFAGSGSLNVDPVDPFRNADENLGGMDERSVFQEVIQDFYQPKQEAEIPDGLLSVPLLRHQKIALAWMRQREARPFCVGGILADDQGLGKTISTIALIQMERHSEQKPKAEDHKIEALILDDDDDDDNGIVDLEDVKLAGDSDCVKSETKGRSSQQSSSKQRPTVGTLVVCPATVLRQWARELKEKVTEDAKLNVLVYHGSNRTKDPSELAKYDVVLTTYAIVTNEVPKQPLVDEDGSGENHGLSAENSHGAKRKNQSSFCKKGKKVKKGKKGLTSCLFDSDCGTLAKVRWLRVVLDEAQTIKNHRTQAARACCGLRAKKRWCLSGTPIQNAIQELFSYFRFLKYDPYSSYKAFCERIKAPISRDPKSGYQKLQVILRTVLLRRTKATLIDGQPVISLPPKYIKMKSVDFTFEERDFYTKLETTSRMQFKAYAEAGTLQQNYANILLMLLRLRQACDHPYLCGVCSDSVRKTDSIQTLKQLPKDKLASLLNCLQGSVICQSCDDIPEDAVITICGHVFCDQCVLDHLASDDNTCPAKKCKEQLSTDVIFSKATIGCCLSGGGESSQSNGDQHGKSLSVSSKDYTSSKIRAALEILQSLGKSSAPFIDLGGPAEDDDLNSHPVVHVRTEGINPWPMKGPQKAIVFSQWTRMLDLMETSLQQYGIHYRRLDGSMSLGARDNAVREFNSNPEVDVMLMSLKAGNLGLNMVAACHVILLDLWWNPTTEDQAIDRAHRIGQTRAVTVSRLTVKDTVEDRILALQEDKRKMVASAFGEESSGASARLTAQDLRFLFLGA